MKKQQENQASLKASTCITLAGSSRGVQGLATGQAALTPTAHPQSSLGDAAPSSGVITCTSNVLNYGKLSKPSMPSARNLSDMDVW